MRFTFLSLSLLFLTQLGGYCLDVDQIVQKADQQLSGDRMYSVSEMTVFRSGKARPTMLVETYSSITDNVERSLSIYRAPSRMKGTAYLMIDDDLWVKFGSTGRTRKLSSSAKKNSAGGSDFSFNDMGESGQGISKKYKVKMVNRNARIEGQECWEIELTPKPDTEGTYEKLVAYVSKDDYSYLQIQYFEAGANIKTLTLHDYQQMGRKLYPLSMNMESHVKPTRTEVKTLEVEFDSSKVEERLFTTSYLKRVK